MGLSIFKNWERIILAIIFLFVIVFCFANLTTRPKLWFDEGINMEMAHNFLVFGKLDVLTAPHVFSGVPYAVGTNGYPLTIPLAGVYSLFGFGFDQTRVYMLCWILAFLGSLYFIVKSYFGSVNALIAVALTATFAPFYGNGLTAFGEIPGFLFLLWGLYFLARNRPKYGAVGLFFALSAVTKPSLYLLLFPAFLVFLLLSDKREFFKKVFKFSSGAIGPVLLWVALIFPNPLSLKTWQSAISFYRYPFGEDFSVLANLSSNLKMFFTHSTLIYFLVFTGLIIFWFFKKGRTDFFKKKLCIFFFIYGVFAVLYFLKSPGWLRYLMAFELLVFVFVPSAFESVVEKIFKKENLKRLAFGSVIAGVLALQLVQLFFFRSDFYSSYPKVVASVINENLERDENYKVGIINAPDIATLVPLLKKYHLVKVGGPGLPFGKNPLSFCDEYLPQFIAFEGKNKYVKEYEYVLDEKYLLLEKIGGYSIYELK